MLTIGIIGGSTDLATAEYYRIMNSEVREQLGGLHTGEIIINSMDLARSAHYVQEGKWEEGAEDVNVPFFHIAEPTAQAIQKQGLEKVVLLGTKATMSSTYLRDVFERQYGLAIVIPDEKDQDVIDSVISDELSYAKFTERSREAYLEVVDKLIAAGAQGIILACTEIGLLISQTDRPSIPMFDTLQLHAKAAALKAVQG
ncbi:hypothetical protein KC331_g7719 [Hortaea werneckii]|nr:hypothetical protein KC331_g7719 [Hortaea werneckii]KAI7713941.1 hypothetical protein KC353_g7169 [Hortaea werneckii]